MSDINTTILSLEMRVGILEDRLACVEPGTVGNREKDRVTKQLELVRAELKKERVSYYEFLRMRCPG
ncbi:hypothetical protein LCGC14_1968650 [marine sediment metagenome]|uniref:Uncharacterized protein n=1 Tax=marine sediment metagenome TaxID=412755 RepID=A0A0F9FCS2_9ZZZZ